MPRPAGVSAAGFVQRTPARHPRKSKIVPIARLKEISSQIPFRLSAPPGARFSLCRDVVAFCGLPNRHLTKNTSLGAFNQ
jgi:hypothetical protein